MLNNYTISKHCINNVEFKFAHWNHPSCNNSSLKQEFDGADYDYIQSIIRSGDVVVDIGTHVGTETIQLAIATGRNGVVYGFEPNPYVFDSINKTAELNSNIVNMIITNSAITERDGKYIFYYSDPLFCNGGFDKIPMLGHTHPLTVNGVNLTRWMDDNTNNSSNIRFIKIDSEGYDLTILKSISKLIDLSRPIIMTELFMALSVDQIRNQLLFLYSMGYECYFFPIAKRRAFGKFDITTFKDKVFTPDDAPLLKKISRGEDLLCIPKEMRV